jgi:hypothetical protein
LKFSRLPRTKRHAPVTPEPFTLENKIMTPRAKTIMLAFTLVSVLAAPFAEAARLGGGKSAGMRRSAPTKSYQQPTPMPAPAAAPQAAPQAQPKGPGIGTAIAAGAAGAAAGYMLGSAMNNNHASGNAVDTAGAGSGIPWGTWPCWACWVLAA